MQRGAKTTTNMSQKVSLYALAGSFYGCW